MRAFIVLSKVIESIFWLSALASAVAFLMGNFSCVIPLGCCLFCGKLMKGARESIE